MKEDENTKLSSKSEPKYYDNINSEIDEKYMYYLDKLSLSYSQKEWCKCEFERKQKKLWYEELERYES